VNGCRLLRSPTRLETHNTCVEHKVQMSQVRDVRVWLHSVAGVRCTVAQVGAIAQVIQILETEAEPGRRRR
jgi:hypothetical protein